MEHWSKMVKIHVILFKLETFFSKIALSWSHVHEWSQNFIPKFEENDVCMQEEGTAQRIKSMSNFSLS